MKKHFVLCVVVFACCAATSFAQLKLNNLLGKQEPLLQIPMVHFTPVSSRFVPIHIDTLKPFIVTLNPIVYGRHESAACEYIKKLKPTLVLHADRANATRANLQWQTKYAFYAKGFTIEKSLGDSLHFSTVHFAAAAEGSSFKKNYHLPDYNDYSGISFYRIKQHNGDTAFMYSNIVAINGVEAVPFKIYPVPATEKVWINVTPKQSGNLSIMVCDLSGKIIQQQYTTCTENRSAETGINISKLAAGLYQVRILMPDKTLLAAKFIKE